MSKSWNDITTEDLKIVVDGENICTFKAMKN